jgi:hypothetical protein
MGKLKQKEKKYEEKRINDILLNADPGDRAQRLRTATSANTGSHPGERYRGCHRASHSNGNSALYTHPAGSHCGATHPHPPHPHGVAE